MNATQAALTRNRPKGQPVQWKKSLNEIEEMICRQTERHIRIEDKVGLDLVLEHVYDDGLLFGYRLPFGLNAIAKTTGKMLAGRVRTKKLNWDAELAANPRQSVRIRPNQASVRKPQTGFGRNRQQPTVFEFFP